MKGVEAFFDSNVIVCYLDPESTPKQLRAASLIREAVESRRAGISAQVMQETINVLFKLGAPHDSIFTATETVLRPLLLLSTTAELIESAIEVKLRWRYAFYDSLIIAGALACNAKTLYSEDMQHGQRIENLTIINPFL